MCWVLVLSMTLEATHTTKMESVGRGGSLECKINPKLWMVDRVSLQPATLYWQHHKAALCWHEMYATPGKVKLLLMGSVGPLW